jgi:uncharacterized membrane protein YeaQ/YmgE (transglycosylase-associated protein family)
VLADTWHEWEPILVGSIALLGLALLATWLASALTRTTGLVLVVPVILYSAWACLWGLLGLFLGVDNQRALATPGLIPAIQGGAIVLVQFMKERWPLMRRVVVLTILLVGLPTAWLAVNYALGTALCG